jgi:hypothetical protein
MGQLDLGFFHFHRQPVAGALFDQLEQAVDAAGVFDVVAHAAQRQLDFCEYTELMVCQVARFMWWLVGM